MQRLAFILLLAALAALNGCAYSAYGLYDDQRLVDTITDDKTLAAGIKTALMNEDFTGGLSIAVYSYYGHVFLVGEVPQKLEGKALAIARRYKPRSLTPHWFSPAKHDTSNIYLATSLRTALIGTKGLSSTRIDTEVNSGRVVLLGVVKDDAEKRLAIRVARGVKGVTSVTSFLMLPPRPGQDAKSDASGTEGLTENELPPRKQPGQNQPAPSQPEQNQPGRNAPVQPAAPQLRPPAALTPQSGTTAQTT